MCKRKIWAVDNFWTNIKTDIGVNSTDKRFQTTILEKASQKSSLRLVNQKVEQDLKTDLSTQKECVTSALYHSPLKRKIKYSNIIEKKRKRKVSLYDIITLIFF